MSGVGVGFVGGPMDGRERWIHCVDPMDPPAAYECVSAQLQWADGGGGPLPVVVRHVYEREVSSRDVGPLWLYRWAGERR